MSIAPATLAATRAAASDTCLDRQGLDDDLQRANEQLARYCEELKALLEEQRRRLQLGEQVLRMAKDGLDCVPLPIIGIDALGRIALINFAARLCAPAGGWTVGVPASEALPAGLLEALAHGCGHAAVARLFERDWLVHVRSLGHDDSRGALLTLLPMHPEAALADINGTA